MKYYKIRVNVEVIMTEVTLGVSLQRLMHVIHWAKGIDIPTMGAWLWDLENMTLLIC